MAGELKYTIGTTYRSGGIEDDTAARQVSVNQTNLNEFNSKVVAVGTVEEDLVLDDITANGFVLLHNLDPVNYVTYGPKSGGVMVTFDRLKPGEKHWHRLAPTVVLRWVANTAVVDVLVKAFGD
jgi:hypothetical protein